MKVGICLLVGLFVSTIALAQGNDVDKNTIAKTAPAAEISVAAVPGDQAGSIGLSSSDYHKAINIDNSLPPEESSVEIIAEAKSQDEQINNSVKKEIVEINGSRIPANQTPAQKNVEIKVEAVRTPE